MRFLALTSALAIAASALPASAEAPTRLRVVSGPIAAPRAGVDVVTSARELATRLAPAEVRLEAARPRTMTSALDGHALVRLGQTHLGVPVLGRGVGLSMRPDGGAAFAAARFETRLPADVRPGLDAADAAARARALTGLDAVAGDATLVLLPLPRGARLAWAVYPSGRVPEAGYAPVVFVDASSGARLAGWNAASRVGLAKVYETNPVASPTLSDVVLPLEPGATSLENTRVRSYDCVDEHDVRDVNLGGFKAKIHTCRLEQKAVADSNGDFVDAPAADTAPEDAFSEISMFFHANKAYDTFRGFGMTDLGTKPLPTVSNLELPAGIQSGNLSAASDPNKPFEPFQNAFFAPANPIFSQIFGLSGGAMWFGQGPRRDYSYDGDVVYHEFTHAVVDHTIGFVGTYHADEQGLVDAAGSMNEGTADYFSSAIAGDPLVGEYASKDIMPSLTAIRDLGGDASCPRSLVGEVHADSLFFSSGLWAVRSGLPAVDRPKLDQAFFDVLAAEPGGDVTDDELVELLVAAVRSSSLGSKVADELTAEMTARGVLPVCRRVLEWAGKPLDGADPNSGHGFYAPGLGDSPDSTVPYAPGVLQFHVALTPVAKLGVKLSQLSTGSSSSAFGGGTPFTPKLLVRFGAEPLRFDWSGDLASNADLMVDPDVSGSSISASVDVPAGATDAWVMVVNEGDTQGIYRGVAFSLDGPLVDADAGSEPGAVADAPVEGDSGGCGCREARSGATGAWSTAALVALVAAAGARRRRSRA